MYLTVITIYIIILNMSIDNQEIYELKKEIGRQGYPIENSHDPRATSFWIEGSDTAQRIAVDQRSRVVEDQTVAWTKVFIQSLRRYQRTFWQRIRQLDIPGVQCSPDGNEWTATKQKESAYIIWQTDSTSKFRDDVRQRIGTLANVTFLNEAMAIVRDDIPHAHHGLLAPSQRESNPHETPEQTIATAQEAVRTIFLTIHREGLLKHGDLGSDLLRQLEVFWNKSVGFSVLKERYYEPVLEFSGMKSMLAAIHPSSHLYSDATTFHATCTKEGLPVVHLPTNAITREFLGFIVLHELTHAYDVVQHGSVKCNTREQSIEMEYRAFTVECAAMKMMYGAELTKVIRSLISKYDMDLQKILSYSSPSGEAFAMNELLRKAIETHLRLPPSLSEKETKNRIGSILAMLAFQFAEDNFPPQECATLQKRFIELLYGMNDFLPDSKH